MWIEEDDIYDELCCRGSKRRPRRGTDDDGGDAAGFRKVTSADTLAKTE